MSNRHGDEQPLATEDDAFVETVANLYAPPPLTASQRTRFDARLEQRIADRARRRRPWFAVAATVVATLSLLLWRASIDAPTGEGVAPILVNEPVQSETDASAGAWILAMTTDPLTDTDDTLPADYVAISDLLLGE